MYADRANMILMTALLISGMAAIPIALILLWHLHSKKTAELRQLRENLRARAYPYPVPPPSALEPRLYGTLDGYGAPPPAYEPRYEDQWMAMRMMMGSREGMRRDLAATSDSFNASGQFPGPLYPPPALGSTSMYSPYGQPRVAAAPPPNHSTNGYVDWYRNVVPRAVEHLDHANTVGGFVGESAITHDEQHSTSEHGTEQQLPFRSQNTVPLNHGGAGPAPGAPALNLKPAGAPPPPLQPTVIPSSQLVS